MASPASHKAELDELKKVIDATEELYASHQRQALDAQTKLYTLRREYQEKLIEPRLQAIQQSITDYATTGKLKLTGVMFDDGGDKEAVLATKKLRVHCDIITNKVHVDVQTPRAKFRIYLSAELGKIINVHRASTIKSYYLAYVGRQELGDGRYMFGFYVLVVHLADNTAHMFHLGNRQQNRSARRYIGYVETGFTILTNITISPLSREQIAVDTTISQLISPHQVYGLGH